MPTPLPQLHAVLTRFEGGDSKRALSDMTKYLGAAPEVMATWQEVPEDLRERVSSLCRVAEVHWERPEHDLFRAALTRYGTTGEVNLGPLNARMRDQALPKDRCFLAASLANALVLLQHGRLVRGQRWAVPPDCLGLGSAG
jgi:hypothetical protein